MNWLERARREISGSVLQPTANGAERNSSAALAGTHPASEEISFGSNGSAPPVWMPESIVAREAFEERAAIMEFDGGLSRAEAERAAWVLVRNLHRLH